MGRTLGAILLIGAAVALGADLYAYSQAGVFRLTAIGELWYQWAPASLGHVQVGLERHLWPPLWDPVLINVLLWPVCVVLAGLGLLFLVLFRRRGG